MNLYGLFWAENDRAVWCLSRVKRQAIQHARTHHAEVRVIRDAYGYGSPSAWDAPTFRVSSDLVADFRTEAK